MTSRSFLGSTSKLVTSSPPFRFIRNCSESKAADRPVHAATLKVDLSPCKYSTSRRKVSRTPPLKRFTSQSTISRQYMSEPRPSTASHVRKFTTHQAAASSCAHGANDRSMLWIHGEIPFVSSSREPFTREGTNPSKGKELSGCILNGFLSYHGQTFHNQIG